MIFIGEIEQMVPLKIGFREKVWRKLFHHEMSLSTVESRVEDCVSY